MTEILATPTSLKIGDHEIPLEEVQFIAGSYDKYGPFFFKDLRELARKRSISSDRDAIYDYDNKYYFLTRDERNAANYPHDPPPDTAPHISFCDVEKAITRYAKFLRIESGEVKERDEVVASEKVRLLEERINSLHLEGLEIIIPGKWKPPTRAHTILRPEIYIELALWPGYHVRIEY